MFAPLIRFLDWLGGHGTRAIALSLFLGMAVPPLSAVVRPLIPEAVFLLLLVAFMRVDSRAVWHRLRKPWLVLAVTAWMMVALPLMFGLAMRLTGLDVSNPAIMIAFSVMVVAPPIMSTPGIAYLLDLDGPLSLAILAAGLVLTPVLCPLIAGILVGDSLPMSPYDLAFRLAGLLGGALIAAFVLRRLAGPERIERSRRVFDGANVVLLFIFAVAIMDGVAVRLLNDPMLVLGMLAAAIAIMSTFMICSVLLFRFTGMNAALTIGISCGNRNMALMVAALAGVIPDVSWIFIAVAQIPIYLLPWLMTPVVNRLTRSIPDQPAQ